MKLAPWNVTKKCLPFYYITFSLIIVYFGLLFFLTQSDIKKIPEIDALNVSLLKIGNHHCSGWTLSHFILYFILGYNFPECDVFIISMGVAWELVECIAGEFTNTESGGQYRYNGTIHYRNWWSGNFMDIVYNIAGFYCGKYFKVTQFS